MYKTRHANRDMRLPKVRRGMLNEITEKLIASTSIEGIFLGGSIAKNNEDIYSDIDLRIIVQEDEFDTFVLDKQRIASSFGDVLFFEDMNPRAPFTIAHYSTFMKVDMFIYTFSRLQPSIWLKNMKIVYDPTGKLKEIAEQSNQLTYEVTREEVEKWRGKVFAYIHEVYRRALREEYFYALTMINNLRSFAVMGWNMEVERHGNEAWDWSKIEGERSQLAPWQLTMLASWNCDRNQEAIMSTLTAMIPELRRLYSVLSHKAGMDDMDKFDEIVSMVL